ncbi:MAG: hypothetical protein U5K53_02620 [Halanaerobiales bacterium]|nr:hypothetical protein [Halanaerobiales bacterium]
MNHCKKSFKDKKTIMIKKKIDVSSNDAESGLFHKGDYKPVFAYMNQTACDKNRWFSI